MYKQNRLHREVETEAKRCRELYRKMQREFCVLPEGSLSLRGNDLCRAVRQDGRQYLVPLRGDLKLYRELKLRRYLKKGMPVLRQRIEQLEHYLENDIIYDPKTIERDLPVQYSGVSGMDIFLKDDLDIESWSNEPYRRNPARFIEVHYTKDKVKMRSKSEAMIGSRLEDYRIIYKPELGLELDNKVVYPDFSILLPNLRTVIIWEHLGRIDDKNYMFDNIEKLIDYGRAGFYLGVNLFLTYEMKGRPLTMYDIDKTISEILALESN